MVSMVVPLPVTEAGLKLHPLSAGRFKHEAEERVIVPLYPFCPLIVRVVCPELAGLVMIMVVGLAVTVKSGAAATVITIAGEVDVE